MNQTISAIKLPKAGRNLKFTLIEKVAGTTIFPDPHLFKIVLWNENLS